MKALKKMFYFFTVPLTLSIAACGFGPCYPHMDNWGHMMRDGYGGGFMWILFLIVIVLLIYFLVQKSKGINQISMETPLDILKMRYAKGEITKEEFDRMKTDIKD